MISLDWEGRKEPYAHQTIVFVGIEGRIRRAYPVTFGTNL